MLKKYINSIAAKTMLQVAALIAVVIAMGGSAAFLHFKENTESLYLAQIKQYITERSARERQIFAQVESNLRLVQERVSVRLQQPITPERLSEFETHFAHLEDGSWRNQPAYSNWREYAGVFIDDETPLTDEVKHRALVFFDLARHFGAAWNKQSPNLYLIGQENFISVYWPEVSWASFVETDIQFTEQPYYFHPRDNNTELKPQWSEVYFDQVSKKWMVSGIAPLMHKGVQVGTVGQDVLIYDMIQRTLNERFTGAFNFIFSRSGHLIAHPKLMGEIYDAGGQFKVKDSEDPLLKLAFEQAQYKPLGHYIVDQPDSDYYLAISHIPEPDWYMVAAYPRKSIEAQAFNSSELVLQISLISLLAELTIVYLLLWWQVGKPLREFTYAIHKVADGERNIFLDAERKDELGGLAKSFLSMQQVIQAHEHQLTQEIRQKAKAQAEVELARDELKEANDQLELRVLQRTETLRATNAELETTLAQLKQTQQQLVEAEKMSSLGGLVAGVAHEINTPIGVCLTAASSVQEELKLLKQRYQNREMTEQDFQHFLDYSSDALEMLVSNNLRASRLIQSFKQVAVDQSSEECRRFELRDYIQEVLFSLQPALKKTAHRVELIGGEGIELESYPGALAQVITNLMMNAVIHGFEHTSRGLIKIQLSQLSSQQVQMTFSDNGCGMNEEGVQKIFEPFYTTKRGAGGSGLGSHLVYNLITGQMKGSIRCESQLGQGTTFTITLPTQL